MFPCSSGNTNSNQVLFLTGPKQDPSFPYTVTHLLAAGGCIIPINCSTKSSWCYRQIHFSLSATLLSKSDLTSGITGLCLHFCHLFIKVSFTRLQSFIQIQSILQQRAFICYATIFLPSANVMKVL